MSVPVKLLGCLAALLTVFGAALGVGRVVGPVDADPTADHGDMGVTGSGSGVADAPHAGDSDHGSDDAH